ncbi:MCE family protein [Streptomyces sp. RB6PN25]|uniref:MCE family protein n=1 Tax=Streptomyces humicola TaxID=2953240 RepID=A0ABT1Q2A3_9ACTN|nr:MCE family protein [Streptomyces humicola]MCQ4084049.1 MCE family protein [Streptomyces humicola]
MIPFRERNPVMIGAIGLTVLALLTFGAFNIQDLPLIGGGDTYSAAFSEAGGLKPGDEVRIAGVKVGQVDDVGLEGDHVRVGFRITSDAQFGTSTGAAIRVKTILGAKYLALEPAGSGQLRAGSEIPLNRTVSAYDVVQAFSDLTTTNEQIDTRQLATALDTVSSAFQDAPDEVKASIKGLSELSVTIASRDAALRDLLQHANGVTRVLATRSHQLTTLVNDGDLLFQALYDRSQVIGDLLRNAADLGIQLSGLVTDNRAQIGPALSRLNAVVDMLKRNQTSLDRSIALLAPFLRLFTNTLGNGPWFDSYIQNLTAAPAVPTPSGGPR